MSERHVQRLVDGAAITVAETVTGEWKPFDPQAVKQIVLQSKLVYGSGGTTCKVYLQTSVDGGETPIDVACHAFGTADARKVSSVSRYAARGEAVPSDAALADDTELDGVIGDRIRIKYVVAGTDYAATTLDVDVILG